MYMSDSMDSILFGFCSPALQNQKQNPKQNEMHVEHIKLFSFEEFSFLVFKLLWQSRRTVFSIKKQSKSDKQSYAINTLCLDLLYCETGHHQLSRMAFLCQFPMEKF